MNRESYDLDVVCYFPRDDDDAAGTLKDVYQNVQNALQESGYVLEPKTSALRVFGRDVDFHVDIVPGRFVDDDKSDVFLYQGTGDKHRLKTNLGVHIAHIRDSGVVDDIRLMKLWKTRYSVNVKTFILELLAIRLLEERPSGLDARAKMVLQQMADGLADIRLEDPANPNGNDLSEIWNDSVRLGLQSAATTTLLVVDQQGWEKVFGEVEAQTPSPPAKLAALEQATSRIASPMRPWRDA